METHYTLVFTGQLLPGFNREKVIDNLISISNMDRERAEKFLSNTQPTIIQKNLNREKAEKYLTIFQKAGLVVRLNPPKPPPLPEQEPAPEPEPTSSPDFVRQKSQKKPAEKWLAEPRVVAASRGWHWLKSATSMFCKDPWKWMGMTMVAFLLQTIVSIFPFFGSIISSLLAMVFAGGMMFAADRQASGKTFTFNYIFKGFHHNRNQLILVGVIYLVGFMAIALILVLIMLLSVGTSFLSMAGNSSDPEFFAQIMTNNIPMFILTLFFGLALTIPLIMGAWFATPLVALHNRDAWSAFKMSIQGCQKNWLPFLVYSLVMIGVGIAMLIILGSLGVLLTQNGFSLFTFLPFLIILFMGYPFMVICGISVFTSFKDIYCEISDK